MRERDDPESVMREAKRREIWSKYWPNRPVKVWPIRAASPAPAGKGKPLRASGYFTLEKYLLNKTPGEIVAQLGLKASLFAAGCSIHLLKRLPLSTEAEYELTAHYPDGLAYNPAMSDPDYPPGARHIHQWRLLIDIDVVPLIELLPGQRFPNQAIRP